MESASLQLNNISKYYMSGRFVTVGLNSVSMSFAQGEFVAVTGESGSGKSTLANILAGILPFESGELVVNGESTTRYSETDWQRYRRDCISYVAQDYGILPGNTVWQNVTGTLRLAGLEKDEAALRAEELLKQVDLWQLKKRRASRLSSGQKQRLAIAGALAKPSRILIADEPTANLDAANSEQILRLLADASKDRLVVMITHDFRLAKRYATRQIVLHDGKLTSDVDLKENLDKRGDMTESVEEPLSQERGDRSGKKTNLSWYIAWLQMYARPVWTVTMSLFFALSAFALFVFLGSFIAALDDTPTRIYNNEAFCNGADTRLVIAAKNDGGFTDGEYEQLLNLPWAESIERYDTVFDINYYYIEKVDYEYRYSVDISSMLTEPQYSDSVIFRNHNRFVRTIPVMKDDGIFLKAGRLPNQINEIVAAGDETLIGTTFPVFFLDRKNWGEVSYVYYDMTVVGVTDYGSGLYFDDRVGRMLYQSSEGLIYGIDSSLGDNQMTITEPMKSSYSDRYQEPPESFELPDFNNPEEYVTFTYAGTNMSKNTFYFEMSEASFDRLCLKSPSVQLSLMIKDYSYTDRAVSAIQKLGYEVVSPYRISSVEQDTQKANDRLSTLVLCIAAAVMIALAQLVVLSAMFRIQMKGYVRLSHRGMSCLTGKNSVLCQIMFFTAVGQLAAAGITAAAHAIGVQQVYDIMKYLTFPHVLLISVLHLTLSLVAALIIRIMLSHTVFPFIRTEIEVDIGELDEEVENK